MDLLGKNDRTIARLPARDPWWPGHSKGSSAQVQRVHSTCAELPKWNVGHSIGGGRPDVVLELWRWSPADFRYLSALGYERASGDVWVRRDGLARRTLASHLC